MTDVSQITLPVVLVRVRHVGPALTWPTIRSRNHAIRGSVAQETVTFFTASAGGRGHDEGEWGRQSCAWRRWRRRNGQDRRRIHGDSHLPVGRWVGAVGVASRAAAAAARGASCADGRGDDGLLWL